MDQDIRSRIQAAAQERGLDPDTLLRFAHAESSLDPNAKAKTSSARGLFQVINKTWKEHGGKDRNDVNEQIRVGADVVASNQESFKRKFNREPSAAELYAYHVLGPTGAPQLLKADPSAPMDQVVSREAYKANPAWHGKTVGDVLGTYEKKVGGSQTPRASAEQPKTRMKPTNYSFEPLTQMDLENLGPSYQAGLAAMALGDSQDDNEDNIAENAQEAKDDAENSLLADSGSRNIANMEFSYASPFPQEEPVQMAKGGEARKMMDAVYRAEGSPEEGEKGLLRRMYEGAVPAQARTFLETAIMSPEERANRPITEKDFSEQEQRQMLESVINARRKRAQTLGLTVPVDPEIRKQKDEEFIKSFGVLKGQGKKDIENIVKNANESRRKQEEYFLSGSGHVHYYDYPDAHSLSDSTLGGNAAVRNTLGRFTYQTTPEGQIKIRDRYDFKDDLAGVDGQRPSADYEKMSAAQKLKTLFMDTVDNPRDRLQKENRSIFTMKQGVDTLPSRIGSAFIGSQGRPVDITVDPRQLMPGAAGGYAYGGPVYRADGSPEYGEVSMGDFSGTVRTGDARKELSNFFKQGWKMPTKEDAKVLAQIPVQALSNLESAARGSIASEIGGFGDIEAAFRDPRADSQAFPTRSGIQGRKETVLPQTQDVLDAMPRKLLPSNDRSEGYEELGTYVGIGPAGYALSKVPAAYRAAAPVVGAAVAKGAEKVKSALKPAERVAPPVTSTPAERPPFSFLLDHPEYLDPIEIVPTGPTAVRGNATADVPTMSSYLENLGVSRYLMPKDFVGGKAVALDTPYPHFVSKLDQFTAALPGAVTKSQYLGSLKGKFRDYEILRAEEALAGLDANAKLKPADIAEKLKNVTPVDRLKTYIDEPSTTMPHSDYDNPHYDKPVGIVNLMTDVPEAQRGTAKEAYDVKRLFEGISTGDGTDNKFTTALKYVNNSDMDPELKARTLSALEDAKVMTDGLRQDTAKISRLLDDLLTPFYNKEDEYAKLVTSIKKKENLSPEEAREKAYQMMRSKAAEAIRKEGYPVPSTIDQMGSVKSNTPEWKELQKAVDRVKDRFNLDQTAKKVDIANRFHDSNKGDSLFNQIEDHLTRKFMYEGQHPSLSKQGEVPVGFSRFVDNVVDIPGRGKTDVMHVLDLQSDLYDDLVKHGGKHTSPQKDSKERAKLTSELTNLLEKASDRPNALKTPGSIDFFKDIPDYLNDALSAAKQKYNKEGKAISANDPAIFEIKNAFNLTDKELIDVVKGIQRQTVLAGRVERSAEWSKNVSQHSYNMDQVFPEMEKSPQVVQQMLVKNAVMGALRRGKQGITFPGAESNQAQLYEKLPNNLRQVVKDLGPGFELVPNIVQDTAGKGQISNWGIVWDPEAAQNVLRAGVRFNKGGSVEKNYDDNRRFL